MIIKTEITYNNYQDMHYYTLQLWSSLNTQYSTHASTSDHSDNIKSNEKNNYNNYETKYLKQN